MGRGVTASALLSCPNAPNVGEEEFPEVGIAPVQLLGVFPEEIGRLAVALRALDAVP